MPHQILKLFDEDEPLTPDSPKFVNVVVEFHWPPEVKYFAGSFFGTPYDPTWKILDGLDATFSLSAFGKVAYPEEFGGQYVDLEINPRGEAERLETVGRGTVGNGWIRDEKLLIRLHVAPRVASDVVQTVMILSRVDTTKPRVFRVGFALVNLKLFESESPDEYVSFEVVRFSV